MKIRKIVIAVLTVLMIFTTTVFADDENAEDETLTIYKEHTISDPYERKQYTVPSDSEAIQTPETRSHRYSIPNTGVSE